MKYLLDVNALIALGVHDHEFHQRISFWLLALTRNAPNGDLPELAACPISELGFVRIVSQLGSYNVNVTAARALLARLQASRRYRFRFLPDMLGASQLPVWVKNPKQVTDGHLLGLARAHGAVLATLDDGIPGALLIPALT